MNKGFVAIGLLLWSFNGFAQTLASTCLKGAETVGKMYYPPAFE